MRDGNNDFSIYLSQLNQIGQSIAKKIHASYEERSTTKLQMEAMKFLKAKPNCTIGELANELQLSMSSATQLIERLTKVTFITRSNDKIDKRITRLKLTSQGENEMSRYKRHINSLMAKALAEVSTEDLQQLLRINQSVIERLQKDI